MGAGIGLYDGVFGPGTGTFLVFGLVALLGYSFLNASAIAKVVNVSTNLAALLVFGLGGHVLWALGLAMGAANLLGAVVGARTAVRRGSAFVRVVFLVVVAVLLLRLGYDLRPRVSPRSGPAPAQIGATPDHVTDRTAHSCASWPAVGRRRPT